MKTRETENMNEVIDKACKNIAELVKAEEADRVRGRTGEVVHDLKSLTKETRNNIRQLKYSMVDCIEQLLAGSGFLCQDHIVQLKDARLMLERELSETEAAKDELENSQEEMNEALARVIKLTAAAVEEVLDGFNPSIIRSVLREVSATLPEREREYKEELAREKLIDELLNDVLGDVDTPTLASFVKESKNNGKLKVPA